MAIETLTYLAGDIGGTKTILALVSNGQTVARATFPSRQHPNLESILRSFFLDHLPAGTGPVARGCLGVAGPVRNDRCEATNLPWVIDARALETEFRFERIFLVNDFTALAWGILSLPDTSLRKLGGGKPDPRGPWVVIGAGTGLGEAVIVRHGAGYEILASEGGHTDFAPRDEREDRLLQFGRARFGRVSFERFVSGPGLYLLYQFLMEVEGLPESPRTAQELVHASAEEAPATISRAAVRGDDPLSAETLELFVSLFGAEAGNLALKVIPHGGVFVAGGIAPKILPALVNGRFMHSFLEKGRMRAVLEPVPVQVVLDTDAGLLGAAELAATLR